MIRRSPAPTLCALCTACVLLSWPSPAFAWKLETHVWIAQQVLNDLLEDDRCALTIVRPELQADGRMIDVPREYFVQPAVCGSLRLHPDEYRTGAIGPDGFPDLASGQITAHPGNAAPSDSAAWSTDRWLRHLVDFFPTNQSYQAFVHGYLSHAAADAFAHSYVNTYAGDIFNLQGETETELRHVALEEYIKSKMPPIVDNQGRILQPSEIVAEPASELFSLALPFVLFHPDAIEQYRRNAGTRHLAAMYDFRAALYSARQKVATFQNTVSTKITSLQNQLEDYTCSGFEWVDVGTCTALEVTAGTLRLSLEASKQVNTLLAQSVAVPLDNWIGNVEEAIREYVRMSERVVIEIMRGGDPTAAIEHWGCVSAPAFLGVPGMVTRNGCEANEQANAFLSGIGSLQARISDSLGPLEWLANPGGKVNDIVATAISAELKELGARLATDLLNKACGTQNPGESCSLVTTMLAYRTTPKDANGLNEIFSVDDSGSGLLPIGDVAARVDADMHLTGGHFDPLQFSAIHNAVVLSKLALLSGAELNRMAALAGVTDTIYGSVLYPDNAQPLLGVFRSIDGNHQWQEYGIPSPRIDGQRDAKSAAERQYGMPAVSFTRATAQRVTSGGLRLWQDCSTREAVFKTIFHGPMTPGIEDLLAPADPNRSSQENPFPFAPESRNGCSGGGVTLEELPGRGLGAVHTEVTSTPTLRLPADVVAEATSAAGAAVTYGAGSATDSHGAAAPVACSPASGSVFVLGTTSVTCTATGTSGTTATGTFLVSVVDTTPPVITVTQSPPPNAEGWNNTNVILTFVAHDTVSQAFTCEMTVFGLRGASPMSVTMTTQGASQAVKVSCLDHSGNRAVALRAVSIDKTPPVVQATRQPMANASGWNNTNVDAHFAAQDALSGIQGAAGADVTFSSEGVGQSATRSFQDRAGNVASATIAGVNIDRTPPTIAIAGLNAGGDYTAGCTPTPTSVASDALSGVASSNGVLTGGNANAVGGFNYTVTSSDLAGNIAVRTATFSVRYDFRGFLPPVPNDGSAILRLGRTVPLKFQLARCDGSIVPNAVARLAATRLTNVVLGTGDAIDVDSAGAANTDNLFRLSDGQYIYNLSTQPFAQGTYRLDAILDDGSVHAVVVSLKSK